MKVIFNGFMAVILVLLFEIAIVLMLWVLRVAIDWWLDIDYVEKLYEFIKRKKI